MNSLKNKIIFECIDSPVIISDSIKKKGVIYYKDYFLTADALTII